MRGMPAAALRFLVGGALVVVFTVALVRGPASGTIAAAVDADSGPQALILPSPLPSLELPLPSVPLPLPSVSLPLPPIDLASPLPSVSLPLPSVPLPSASLPLPSVSLPVPTASASPSAPPTPGPTAATTSPGATSSVSPSGTPAPATPVGSPERSARDGGAGDDRRPPTGAGRAGVVGHPQAAPPSWLVPSLAFGVPLLLLVGAVLAQLAGGVAVLGIARRMLSRFPGPTPRWMRGASDAGDGS
jgi:hypothetical protein